MPCLMDGTMLCQVEVRSTGKVQGLRPRGDLVLNLAAPTAVC